MAVSAATVQMAMTKTDGKQLITFDTLAMERTVVGAEGLNNIQVWTQLATYIYPQ